MIWNGRFHHDPRGGLAPAPGRFDELAVELKPGVSCEIAQSNA